MKRKFVLVCVLLPVLSLTSSAELFHDYFDDYGMGVITNKPSWSVMNDELPGIVTNTRFYSSPHSVLLPVPPGAPDEQLSGMVVTGKDTYVWTDADCPVLRTSARIYCENNSQTIAMLAGHETEPRFEVVLDGADGKVKLNGRGAHYDTGVQYATNRFAEIVVYYNVADVSASLDYNGTNVQPWISLGGSVATQFSWVGFFRADTQGGAGGAAYVDNVDVDIFPASTMAWWRFNEGSGNRTAEHTGRFPATGVWLHDGHREWQTPPVDLVYTGRGDVPDNYSFSGPQLNIATNSRGVFLMTNWTFEAVLRYLPGADNTQILIDFGVGRGFDTSNSRIAVSWSHTYTNFLCYLRDNNQTTDDYQYIFTDTHFPPDGNWHHLALVKSNNNIYTYIDYEAVATNGLTADADADYEFGPDARARLGAALNGAAGGREEQWIDEVRLSDGVLPTEDFLQAARPMIEKMENDPESANWDFWFSSIPGFDYWVQYTFLLEDSILWNSDPTMHTATEHGTPAAIPRKDHDSVFIRIRRSEHPH